MIARSWKLALAALAVGIAACTTPAPTANSAAPVDNSVTNTPDNGTE